MRVPAATLVLMGLMTSTSFAQSEAVWVIVPSTLEGDEAWAAPTARAASSEIADRGVAVLSGESAGERFEAEVSFPAAAVGEAELQHWLELSDGAVRDLALGENARALQKLEEAQAFSQGNIEWLNRDPQRSQQVLDTCLYLVRALLAVGSPSRARQVARECRKLVPRGEPTPEMHPPAVMDLLQQVDASRVKQSGALEVRSVPSACTARLNGVLLGETPVEIGQLFPGRYRLQVECDTDQPARVHAINVGVGRASVTIDARFDSVVETRPELLLRYATEVEQRSHSLVDAQRVAKDVSADRVLILSRPSARTLELVLADPKARTRRAGLSEGAPRGVRALGFARIASASTGPDRADLAEAAHALTQGLCMDFTGPKPVSLDCEELEAKVQESALQPQPEHPHRRPRGQFISGVTLAAVGISGLAAGYLLLIPRANASEDWYADVDQGQSGIASQQRWLDLSKTSYASAAVGAGALVTAMPLALPDHGKTPWWAWLSGGAGVGLAAFSVAYGVTADAEPSTSCSGEQPDTSGVARCVSRGEQISASVLTGIAAAPLITMPLVYLFRRSKTGLQPQATVSRSGAYLVLRGRF